MTVQELFARIGKKKIEAASTTYQRYRELLVAVATAKKFDDDEAETILEEHGKGQDEFNADVEVMRARLRAVENIQVRKKAEAEAANFHNLIEKANEEFVVIQKRHNASVDELSLKMQIAEGTVRKCVDAEFRLKNSCLDVGILAREKELSELKKPLSEKRRLLVSDLNSVPNGTLANNLLVSKQKASRWSGLFSTAMDAAGQAYYGDEAKAHAKDAELLQRKVESKQQQLKVVDGELAKINVELEKLNGEKLTMTDDWRERAETLCVRVGLTEPVYLVDVQDAIAVDPRLRFGDCIAWTSPLADLLLKPAIGNRWRGPGFAAVINRSKTPTIRDYAGAALHELSHYLADHPEPVQECSQEFVNAARAAMPAKLADPKTSCDPPPDKPRWFQHDSSFVRAACHLAYRAYERTNCGSIRPKHLRYASQYFGISENTFQSTLEVELDNDKSIREILRTKPPKAFMRCWAIATGRAATVNIL